MSDCKWNVLKDKTGKVKSAGFCEFIPKDGETVEAYDDVDMKIVKALKA